MAKGSFRGIEFFIIDDSAPIGPRAQITEMPYRAKAHGETFGSKARVFNISAFVLGPNYQFERTQLIDAINKDGPGELFHPEYGRINCIVTNAEVSHDSRALDRVNFTLEFTEVENRIGAFTIDTQNFTLSKVITAKSITIAKFEQEFVPSINSLTRKAATDNFNRMFEVLETSKTALLGFLEPIKSANAKMSVFNSKVQKLFSKPLDLAKIVTDELAALANNISSPFEAIKILGAIANYRLPRLRMFGSNNAKARAQNAKAINSLFAANALLEIGNQTTFCDFDSREDAMKFGIEIADYFDAFLDGDLEVDENTYLAVLDVKHAIAADIQKRGADLVPLKLVTVSQTEPLLCLCHRLYGTSNFDPNFEDLNDRTQPSNPFFVNGGQTFEVRNA